MLQERHQTNFHSFLRKIWDVGSEQGLSLCAIKIIKPQQGMDRDDSRWMHVYLLQWTSVTNTSYQETHIIWNSHLGKICIQLNPFTAVLLSSSNELLFCANMEFSGGSFGTKLRSNLLGPVINSPEEIQRWSNFPLYLLRRRGKASQHSARESSNHQLWQEGVRFQCLCSRCACVQVCTPMVLIESAVDLSRPSRLAAVSQ